MGIQICLAAIPYFHFSLFLQLFHIMNFEKHANFFFLGPTSKYFVVIKHVHIFIDQTAK